MANVTGKVRIIADGSQVPDSLPGVATPLQLVQPLNCNFGVSGTIADQVDSWSTFTLDLTAAPQTIDLTALVGVYGAAVNFRRIRRLIVKVLSTTDSATLTISPGASNGWTALLGAGSTLVLRAATQANDSGLVLVGPSATGWVVGPTGRTLTFDPGASTFQVQVELMGASS